MLQELATYSRLVQSVSCFHLSGPIRDTPPNRAIPCRDGIAEQAAIASFCDSSLLSCAIAQVSLSVPLAQGFRTSSLCAKGRVVTPSLLTPREAQSPISQEEEEEEVLLR